MYPEKYFRDLESSRRRMKRLQELKISTGFISSFLILGPLIHEIAHIYTLKLIECGYNFDLEFTLLSGLHGKIHPYCALENSQAIAFYLSGYTATILLATVILMLSIIQKKQRKLLSMVSAGLFMSVILGVGKGDIPVAAEYMRTDPLPISLSVLLIVIVGTFISLELIFKREENQKG